MRSIFLSGPDQCHKNSNVVLIRQAIQSIRLTGLRAEDDQTSLWRDVLVHSVPMAEWKMSVLGKWQNGVSSHLRSWSLPWEIRNEVSSNMNVTESSTKPIQSAKKTWLEERHIGATSDVLLFNLSLWILAPIFFFFQSIAINLSHIKLCWLTAGRWAFATLSPSKPIFCPTSFSPISLPLPHHHFNPGRLVGNGNWRPNLKFRKFAAKVRKMKFLLRAGPEKVWLTDFHKIAFFHSPHLLSHNKTTYKSYEVAKKNRIIGRDEEINKYHMLVGSCSVLSPCDQTPYRIRPPALRVFSRFFCLSIYAAAVVSEGSHADRTLLTQRTSLTPVQFVRTHCLIGVWSSK